MTFGDWLRDRRRVCRLTQDELAQRVGVSKTYISNLERDAPHPNTGVPVMPSPVVLRALARGLRVDIMTILRALYPEGGSLVDLIEVAPDEPATKGDVERIERALAEVKTLLESRT